MTIPALDHTCNSWIVTRKRDGKVIGEIYKRVNVEKFDLRFFNVETATQYLTRINQESKRD